MVEHSPVSAKVQSRLRQFGRGKVLPGIFICCVLYEGCIWRGDIMVADVEELESLDASEVRAGRLNAKEVLMPEHGKEFVFFAADGVVKLVERDQVFRKQEHPARGKEHNDDLQGESDGFQPSHQETDDGKARNGFWSFSNHIYLHHGHPRFIVYVPKERSFPIPLKNIDVVRRTNKGSHALEIRRSRVPFRKWNS